MQNRLKDMREDADFSQAYIAKFLGASQQQYSDWENGKHSMKIEHYIKLALFYNVSIDYLCGLIETPKRLK